MGNRRHHSTPLRPHACREKNHKTCEDDLADHDSHLKPRPAEPSTNNVCPLRRMHPAQHWFQSNSFVRAKFPRSPRCRAFLCNGLIHHSLLPIPGPQFPIPYSLPLCYNRRAVERAANREPAQVQAEPAQAAVKSAAPSQGGPNSFARTEDPSRYCPVCSQQLESRRCKLICSVCGYYMSCSDYY